MLRAASVELWTVWDASPRVFLSAEEAATYLAARGIALPLTRTAVSVPPPLTGRQSPPAPQSAPRHRGR